jgi:predicted MPP superfamily phosphohydrolase
MPAQAGKRRWLARRRFLAAASGALVGGLCLDHRATLHPKLERVEIRLPRLPREADGLRVALLADTHMGLWNRRPLLERAIALARAECPDIVVLAGDYCLRLDRKPQATYDAAILPFGKLSAHYGVFAVPGNHDYWCDIGKVRTAFRKTDIPLLANEHRVAKVPGGELAIVGFDDLWEGARDVSPAYDGLADDLPRITLNHNPDRFVKERHRDLSLMLSGHTHGGQIVIPGWGPLSVPSQYSKRFAMGHHVDGRNQLYVTRGVGTCGVPFRLFCPAEVTLITLRAPAAHSSGKQASL